MRFKMSKKSCITTFVFVCVFQAVQAQESKRRKRRIMKIAVYVMFGIIAVGVFAIWLFHKDQIESIKFKTNFLFTVKVIFSRLLKYNVLSN